MILRHIQQRYDPVHRSLGTDIYEPEGEIKGTILDIHGGGWFRGDKSKDADLADKLAKAGYFVAVPNYRLAPDRHYPAPLEDLDQLIIWLTAQSAYDIDMNHIGAIGGSAGGNIAVELAIKYGMPAVSLSGILDIDDWLAGHESVVAQEGNTSSFNSLQSAQINQDGANDAFYKWFVTNYFGGRTDEYEAATPYHRVTEKTGPMFLANSLNEFVPTSGVSKMAETLTDAGIPYTTRMLTGSRHAKGYLDDVYDEALLFLNQFV